MLWKYTEHSVLGNNVRNHFKVDWMALSVKVLKDQHLEKKVLKESDRDPRRCSFIASGVTRAKNLSNQKSRNYCQSKLGNTFERYVIALIKERHWLPTTEKDWFWCSINRGILWTILQKSTRKSTKEYKKEHKHSPLISMKVGMLFSLGDCDSRTPFLVVISGGEVEMAKQHHNAINPAHTMHVNVVVEQWEESQWSFGIARQICQDKNLKVKDILIWQCQATPVWQWTL